MKFLFLFLLLQPMAKCCGFVPLLLPMPATSNPNLVTLHESTVPVPGTDNTGSSTTTIDKTQQILKDTLAKMNIVMSSSEFLETNPVLKQMVSKMNKNIEIKDSSIVGGKAGLGLFATKNIKAGTIVSFYPAHALGEDSETEFVSLLEDDASYFADHPPTQSSYLHCTDQPIFGRLSALQTQDPLYLDVNPNRDRAPTWVSQMINDGAVIADNTEAGVLKYYQESGNTKNCIHIPFGPSPILATVTTKKVKKGEELFTSYGGTYWLGVWLDVHGEDGVPITPAIQAEIQTTATDLFTSKKGVETTYTNQIDALQQAFDAISI